MNLVVKVISMIRIHFGTGSKLSMPGGTHSVIIGLSDAQKELGHNVIIVDQIKFFGKAFNSTVPIKSIHRSKYVNEFHFCLSFLHILLRHPRLIFRAEMNILHFHGPWYLESKMQKPQAKLKNSFKLLLEFFILHSFRRIVCVSHAFKNILETTYRINPKRITVIPIGIDSVRFKPIQNNRSKQLSKSEMHLGTVRRLVPRMGLEILIESMCYVDSSRLTIAGIGPLENDLKKLVAKLGLNSKVKFVGYIQPEDLPTFYRSLDLCVIPSVALEGFCLTALEAMACGIPVIATNLDGLKESVGKCDSRLLFEANSITALVAQISLAKDNFVGDFLKFRQYSLGYSWTSIALTLEELIQLQSKQRKKFN